MAFGPTANPIGLFEEGLPVRLIATKREDFVTCRPDDQLATVVERNRDDEFDFLPVIDRSTPEGRIIGLAEMVRYTVDPILDCTIVDVMRPLAEGDFIGADAGILSYVREGDTYPFRFVVSGPRISGLVHLTDLQKLPVRAALFAMITHLEMVMADRIRREFIRSEAWLGRLSACRQHKIRDKCSKAKREDSFVNMLLFTQFADKITIIKKEPAFRWNRGEFDKELHRVQDLRDKLAHANDYAVSRADRENVCRTIRLMDTWIARLAEHG